MCGYIWQGTVLIKTAADLMSYSKGEETQIEEVWMNIHVHCTSSLL